MAEQTEIVAAYECFQQMRGIEARDADRRIRAQQAQAGASGAGKRYGRRK